MRCNAEDSLRLRLRHRPLHGPERRLQQPRGRLAFQVDTEPPQLHRGVLQRLGRSQRYFPLYLVDLAQQLVNPLAGSGPGQGVAQNRTGLVEPLQFEQAGFEAVFEGGEIVRAQAKISV